MRSIYGRGKPLQAAIYACCLSAFLFFGYDQGVFGGLLQNTHWLDQFNHPRPVITGIITSSYCLGALTGCVINFFIGDILGRRRMIWLAMGLIIIGATLQTSAFTIAHLMYVNQRRTLLHQTELVLMRLRRRARWMLPFAVPQTC